jgi:Glycosyl transferase family 2
MAGFYGDSLMKVSIITATYNSESTLKACLDSVANQTGLANIEHIIVDGRSKDSTLALVSQYPHISKIVSDKDRGIYHAFNRGIALATGDLVYFLNSDDCFYDTKVIADVLSAFSSERQYYLGSVLCQDAKTGNSYFTLQNDSTQNNRRPCHQGFFCRRELFERFGLFNECFTIAADMYFMKKVLHHTTGIVTDRVIAKFSLQGMSSSSDNQVAMMRQHAMIDELLEGDDTQQELSEKLALQMQNGNQLKQLLVNVLHNKLDLSHWMQKRVAIFGVRELSQTLSLIMQQHQLEVSCFVVSNPQNVPQGLDIPVVGINELGTIPVDVVINCIEGKHETEISAKIKQVAPEAKIVSWRAFCHHNTIIPF